MKRLLATGLATTSRSEPILPRAWAYRITVIFAVVVLLSVARTAQTLSEPVLFVAVADALVFVGSILAGTVRLVPVAVLVGGLCGSVLEYLIPGGSGYVMAIVGLIQAGRLEETTGRAVGLVIGAAYVVVFAARVHQLDLSVLISPVAGLVFAYLATSSFRRLQAEKQKTEGLLQQVIAGRDSEVRAAALEERARLAREIHDILAHTLSALTVQLETIRMLAEHQQVDARTREAVERAGQLAREGLREGRRAVGALRDEAPPGPESLPRLAADFERDAGIHCRLTVSGDPVALSLEARLALYRTAQEALTNIRKHADASHVDIRLHYAPEAVSLSIEDQGVPKAAPIEGGGYGLAGLRERADLARGSLEAGPTLAGFRVCLRLPS